MNRRPADHPGEEIARLRRIETRLTQLMVAMGVRTEAQRPEFSNRGSRGKLVMPSKHCTFKEALDTIPQKWDGPVDVFVGEDRIATIAPS